MKISRKKLCLGIFEIAFVFLLFQQNIFPSELTFISLLLTVIAGIFLIMLDGKFYLNPFLISYGLFFLFALILSLIGWGTGNVEDRLMLLLMKYVSSIFIYNYLMRLEKPEKFMRLYVAISIISLVIIFLLVGDNAVASRLGHNGSGSIVSYQIAGVPIYKSSNGTATFCAIATLFLLYYSVRFKKWYCYIFIVFLTIGMLLSGSRKGLLIYILYIIYTYFFMRKGITLKKIVLFLVVPIAGYILLSKVPIIYDAVGIRLESMIMNIFSQSNSLDGNSYLMRQQLKNVAYEWIGSKPFLGYGFNTFQTATGYGAENNLLQIMVEFGLIGALIYYSFLFSLFRVILRIKNKSVLAGLFSVLILSILLQDYGSVTYSWQHMTIWYSVFWAVANHHMERKKFIKLYNK
ncbi:O-antigen polymerase [Bacillus sp. AFS055030]|uniref:O-antigen ligase family protein n=1 Tax=Bacillus sp. AFS055030 TaxID=2033507 RepID=UPI000BFB6355|nr:O-antigen polymerase [Bacillus sp. AFS055030]PGL72703.1 hypothetical protein CN925_03020 [Bacillus sp. AFS055030]